MIGQGAICAESKEDALDWLKIIKTAFILSDTNNQDLDYNNFKSNFIFEDIEEFGVSSSYGESQNPNYSNYDGPSIFNSLNDSIFEKSAFGRDNDMEKDNGLNSSEDNLNVFNLKSLKSMEDEEDDSSLDEEINDFNTNNEDYGYDEEDIDEDDEEEIYSAFSNLWG